MKSLPSSSFPRLKEEEIQFMNKPDSNEEIRSTLFDMGLLRAPDNDGFHALFFQSQWDHVGASVCTWVKKIFVGECIDPEFNNTLVVLIPKVNNLESFFLHFYESYC